eukprot:TRINITY_DN5659_c0_g1_i2.p2 TRINITY_DN5659_c0_g1~~TRINITY_DN5659_c0_g1_i2.p2  ORF type:complete len:234 (-),score=29.65 TRINITY_DN5659_c0_g1_i2:1080-1781(-)
MVDYSKWDHFGEDEEDEDVAPRPTVTRLEKASKVHVRGGEVSIEEPETTKLQEIRTEGSGFVENTKNEAMTKNGGSCEKYLFSQTRSDCTIYVIAPAGTSAKQISVQVLESGLSVGPRGGSPWVGGELAFPIVVDDDGELGCWQVKDWKGDPEHRRVVEIAVRKKVVSEGVTIWWNRVWKADPPLLDVTAIPDRKTAGSSSASFAEAWEKAHEQFRQKMEQRQPISVDLEEDE